MNQHGTWKLLPGRKRLVDAAVVKKTTFTSEGHRSITVCQTKEWEIRTRSISGVDD